MAHLTRRSLLAGASAGLLAPDVQAKPDRRERAGGKLGEVRLGVASYSLRELSRSDAIAAIRDLGSHWVSVKSMHLPYGEAPAALAAARREFEEAGIEVVGGGVVYLQKNDPEDVGKYFEYARACGMPLMTIGPTAETLPLIEQFVKRYDISVAIHNHGPEDEHFPSPYEALEAISEMDPRIGVCIDLGHTARTGVDVVQAVADSGDRLLDLHLKDLRDLADKESQCIVGEGAMPFGEIFRQLQHMRYAGYANLEYEIDGDDPLPGMRRSFAYLRGVSAGLRAATVKVRRRRRRRSPAG